MRNLVFRGNKIRGGVRVLIQGGDYICEYSLFEFSAARFSTGKASVRGALPVDLPAVDLPAVHAMI